MGIACFVSTVDIVENLGNDLYRVGGLAALMDANNSAFRFSFEAVKGSDWKIQCRESVIAYVQANYSLQVDLVILPGLDTI